MRAEGPEEITPPVAHRISSFDSLSAAKALCNQLPVSFSPGPEADVERPAPGSPTVAAAAAALHQVQSSDVLEGAVDCLMSFSSHAADASLMPPPKKRPAPVSASASSTRRKLKMRAAPSPLSYASTSNESQHSASTMEPLSLLSSSNVDQLKLLAAAFKLCPTPSDEQLAAIASRVGMDPESLGHWFHQRRVLQDWIKQQPQVSSSSLRSMFYGGDALASPTEGMPPPLAPWRTVNAA